VEEIVTESAESAAGLVAELPAVKEASSVDAANVATETETAEPIKSSMDVDAPPSRPDKAPLKAGDDDSFHPDAPEFAAALTPTTSFD
jgi:hypothetical protein